MTPIRRGVVAVALLLSVVCTGWMAWNLKLLADSFVIGHLHVGFQPGSSLPLAHVCMAGSLGPLLAGSAAYLMLDGALDRRREQRTGNTR